MAKKLKNVVLFVGSQKGEKKPSKAIMTYDVEEGKAKKTGNVYSYTDPDFSLSANDFWAVGFKAIKITEKIKKENI